MDNIRKNREGLALHNHKGGDFIRFGNAYKDDNKLDQKRIRLDSILTYSAYDWINYGEASYQTSKKKLDLGGTAYCIEVNYAMGGYRSEDRIFFWTKAQRDETLLQLDYIMGIHVTDIEPMITVINPSYDKIPEGSAIIQDLPKL